MPTAVITGASAGLGRALALSLAAQGWRLVVDARTPDRLARLADELLAGTSDVTAIPGDVADPAHRAAVAAAIGSAGRLDLLVNNASTLGPTPLRPLTALTAAELAQILEINAIAPIRLTAALLAALRRAGGAVLDVSSDAAVAHYPDWGGYGAAKAALDHATLTSAAEHPDIAWYAVDPGDMRTAMQQAAFPGEDVSDRRDPAEVAPGMVDLVRRRPPSGRYRIDPTGVAVPAGGLVEARA